MNFIPSNVMNLEIIWSQLWDIVYYADHYDKDEFQFQLTPVGKSLLNVMDSLTDTINKNGKKINIRTS